ncbi:MAG: cyclase family protein [Pseudomonadota bacterium]
MRLIKMMMAAAGLLTMVAPAAAEDHAKSPYGPDDTIGAANNLSPDGVLAASKLVKTGKTYPLGVITGRDSPAYPGRAYDIEVFPIPEGGANKVTGHDDRLVSHVGIGSQLDGLGHIGVDKVHYNGITAEEIFDPKGLKKLGTEHVPPIVTRGVLIDIAAHRGVAQLAPMASFGSAEIQAAAKAQGVTIGKGDVVLFHTGWLAKAEEDPAVYIGQQPGINAEGAKYLAELGVVAVGADSAALETMDFGTDGTAFPVHAMLLAHYGVYILETMNTADLARDKAWEFMFVLGQPRFAGSVQAVINPIAIR